LDAETAALEERHRSLLRLLAHEIRTPLHAVQGFSELLLAGAVGPLSREALDCAQQIARAGRALGQVSRLVQELAAAGPVRRNRGEPLDLRALLAAEGFALSGEGDLPPLRGTPSAWRRALGLCRTYLAWPESPAGPLPAAARRLEGGGLELELRHHDMREADGMGLLAIELARHLMGHEGGALRLREPHVVAIGWSPRGVAAAARET
jgi:hypothetical protein